MGWRTVLAAVVALSAIITVAPAGGAASVGGGHGESVCAEWVLDQPAGRYDHTIVCAGRWLDADVAATRAPWATVPGTIVYWRVATGCSAHSRTCEGEVDATEWPSRRLLVVDPDLDWARLTTVAPDGCPIDLQWTASGTVQTAAERRLPVGPAEADGPPSWWGAREAHRRDMTVTGTVCGTAPAGQARAEATVTREARGRSN